MAATVTTSRARVASLSPGPASPLASLSTSSPVEANQAPATISQLTVSAIGAQFRRPCRPATMSPAASRPKATSTIG